jgi:hypothetical protein
LDIKTTLHTGAGNAGKARNTGKFKTTMTTKDNML